MQEPQPFRTPVLAYILANSGFTIRPPGGQGQAACGGGCVGKKSIWLRLWESENNQGTRNTLRGSYSSDTTSLHEFYVLLRGSDFIRFSVAEHGEDDVDELVHDGAAGGKFGLGNLDKNRLQVLGVGERDLAGLFKDIEYGNPVFPGGFHADLSTVQFRQPITKVSKTFGESGKPGFIVIGSVVTVGNANASVNPSFVYVEAATVIQDDLEHGVPPAKYLQSQQGLAVRKIESISKR